MTSKERVLTAFARREPDRLPINYMANCGIDARLKAHFGLAADNAEGLRRALGVDFRAGSDGKLHGVAMVGSIEGQDPAQPWANRGQCYFHAQCHRGHVSTYDCAENPALQRWRRRFARAGGCRTKLRSWRLRNCHWTCSPGSKPMAAARAKGTAMNRRTGRPLERMACTLMG